MDMDDFFEGFLNDYLGGRGERKVSDARMRGRNLEVKKETTKRDLGQWFLGFSERVHNDMKRKN